MYPNSFPQILAKHAPHSNLLFLPIDKIRIQTSFAQTSTIGKHKCVSGAGHNNFKFLSSSRLTKLQNRGEIHWTSRRMVVREVV